jgi:hypothetical protein
MKRLRGKLTYANVMATIAVFLVLGGSAVAATHLPGNSVGTKQLKKGAVTPGKLSAKTRRFLVGPGGPTGDRGPQGAEGPRGIQGKEGAPGRDLTVETPLASGHTETGVFGAAGGESPFMLAVVSFVQPLAAGLDGDNVFLLEE